MAAEPTQVKNISIHYQTGTDHGTVYALWAYDGKHAASYDIVWQYTTGNRSGKKKKLVWFEGSSSNVKIRQSTYSVPSNATKVRIKIKPVSDTYTSGRQQKTYFTGKWLTSAIFTIKSGTLPTAPSVPDIEIENTATTVRVLTVSIDNYTIAGGLDTTIEFQIIANDSAGKAYKSGSVAVRRGRAALSWSKVGAGNRYKVRARAHNKNGYSAWSDYSSNVISPPAQPAPKPAPALKAQCYADDAAKVIWQTSVGATGYEIEYTDDKEKFDVSSDVQSDSSETTDLYRIITGLETGKRWWFRVRGTNSAGHSVWRGPVSTVLGTRPSAPTTWTYQNRINPTQRFLLNWTHNSEDGSDQSAAQIRVTVKIGNDSWTTTPDYSVTGTESYIAVNGTQTGDKTLPHAIEDGATIEWQVRTRGVLTTGTASGWSPWSTKRTISVYAAPELSISVANTTDVEGQTTITAYPLDITLTATPSTQSAISISMSIAADSTYVTELDTGVTHGVAAGTVIFSKVFDNPENNEVTMSLTPGDLHIEEGQSYVITATVGMNTGLSATATAFNFTAQFGDENYIPGADVQFDDEMLSVSITPYCTDDEGADVTTGVYFNVYRREYDGSFVPIYLGLDVATDSSLTDPYPSLDYARYRIVVVSKTTGQISYSDIPGVSTGVTSVVIQWDEEWTYFDPNDIDDFEAPVWSGSLLTLPYNIDVSDTFNPDTALIEYIGREYPVTYYGTQKGHTANWKVEIPKSDQERLYSIRRLARYPGDCYVREPSGTGYWAQINVSYQLTHGKPTVPVTLSITHVDGPPPYEPPAPSEESVENSGVDNGEELVSGDTEIDVNENY